jgi:hypothetical protein
MEDQGTGFSDSARLADELIEKAKEEELGDVSRRPALSQGHHRETSSNVPRETLG